MAYEPKTKPTNASVTDFIAGQPKEETRQDCATLVKLMKRITGAPAVMWGPSIVGFGIYHYVYASGAEGDWPVAAFSPRKQDLTIYVMAGFVRYPALMKKLGKCRTSVSCLYLKRLADVDLAVLEELITESVAHTRRTYPAAKAKVAKPKAKVAKPKAKVAPKPKSARAKPKAAPKRAARKPA